LPGNISSNLACYTYNMQVLQVLNPENVSQPEWEAYPVRKAVRALVFDELNNMALLHVTNNQFYKLPGGGMEAGEDNETALQRECQEEIGCAVEILKEIGSIIEYRKFASLQQISFCYLAKLKGKKSIPQYMEDEIADGFRPLWVPFQAAQKLLTECQALDPEGKIYIVPRDTLFVQTAEQFVKELL